MIFAEFGVTSANFASQTAKNDSGISDFIVSKPFTDPDREDGTVKLIKWLRDRERFTININSDTPPCKHRGVSLC